MPHQSFQCREPYAPPRLRSRDLDDEGKPKLSPSFAVDDHLRLATFYDELIQLTG
jgi:hypothetical protein